MATTNGSLDPIYQRLNSVDRYHPFSSDTFHDWSMEAGDTINVSRDGSTIQSPVHTTTLTWKGQPKVTVSSEGSETRPSVTRQTKNKYGRGGSGLRNDMGMWRYMSDIYGALTSSLELTESRLWLEFQGRYDGLQSELEFTRSALRIEFRGLYDGLSSHFELTRSQLQVTFQGMYDGLSSEFLLTRSELRTEFRGLYDGLNSEFQITRSELRAEFEGLYDGLSSDFQLTRSQLRVEFEGLYDGLSSDFRLTRSELRTEFKGLYDGLSSDLTFTRSALQTEFRGLYDGLSSDFRLTRSEMKVEFKGMYDGLSSSLEFTRSSLTTTIRDNYNGLSSRVTQTASSWSTRVSKIVDKDGNIKAAEITVAINESGSEARINADKIYLLGQTIANQITADYISSKIATLSSLTVNALTVNGTIGASTVEVGTLKFRTSSGAGYSYSDLKDLFVTSVEITGPDSNNLYTLKYHTANDPTGVTGGTFSRAVSEFTGSWSGNHYQVTVSPQNQTGGDTYVFTSTPTWSNITDGKKGTISIYYIDGEGAHNEILSAVLDMKLTGAWSGNTYTATMKHGNSAIYTISTNTFVSTPTWGTGDDVNKATVSFYYFSGNNRTEILPAVIDASSRYNAGAPSSGSLAGRHGSGYDYDFIITKGDGTTKTLTINCSSIYTDARTGYTLGTFTQTDVVVQGSAVAKFRQQGTKASKTTITKQGSATSRLTLQGTKATKTTITKQGSATSRLTLQGTKATKTTITKQGSATSGLTLQGSPASLTTITQQGSPTSAITIQGPQITAFAETDSGGSNYYKANSSKTVYPGDGGSFTPQGSKGPKLYHYGTKQLYYKDGSSYKTVGSGSTDWYFQSNSSNAVQYYNPGSGTKYDRGTGYSAKTVKEDTKVKLKSRSDVYGPGTYVGVLYNPGTLINVYSADSTLYNGGSYIGVRYNAGSAVSVYETNEDLYFAGSDAGILYNAGSAVSVYETNEDLYFAGSDAGILYNAGSTASVYDVSADLYYEGSEVSNLYNQGTIRKDLYTKS